MAKGRLQDLHDDVHVRVNQHCHLRIHLHDADDPQATGIHRSQCAAHDHPDVSLITSFEILKHSRNLYFDFQYVHPENVADIQLRRRLYAHICHGSPFGPDSEAIPGYHRRLAYCSHRSHPPVYPAEGPTCRREVLWLRALYERRVLRLPWHAFLGL